MPLHRLGAKRVVVLPDLYLDAVVRLPAWSETSERLAAIAARGGGNLPVGPIDLRPGGNAANLALALARLGAHVKLVAETGPLARGLLERAAKGSPLDLSHVREGETSTTLALECDGANVMLSHAGTVSSWGPQRLTAEDKKAIEEADAVAVVNWAQNQEGTALQQGVAQVAQAADTMVYVDTGDPRHRGAEKAQLGRPEAWAGVSAWGLNENELLAFSDAPAGFVATQASLVEQAAALSARLDVPLDLHTRAFAAAVTPHGCVVKPADATPGRRATGAGDAWNAGNLAGHLLDLPPDRRLGLAHEVATRYVLSEEGRHPGPHEVAAALA